MFGANDDPIFPATAKKLDMINTGLRPNVEIEQKRSIQSLFFFILKFVMLLYSSL